MSTTQIRDTIVEQFRTIARETFDQRLTEILGGTESGATITKITTTRAALFGDGNGHTQTKGSTRKLKRKAAKRTVTTTTVTDGGVLCAIIGCGEQKRSKGFCSKHYQKFKMLEKRNELPNGWVENAEPNSIENVTLPRGRAASKGARA